MSEHVVTPRVYYSVFAALIALTLLTVGLSYVSLGPPIWHTVTGLTIATVKALLVVLFFMHVLYSTRLPWLVVLATLFWLSVLIVFTLSDYLTPQHSRLLISATGEPPTGERGVLAPC